MADQWTPGLRLYCELACGDVGDPPCWRLPEITSDCPEMPAPCADCLARDCAPEMVPFVEMVAGAFDVSPQPHPLDDAVEVATIGRVSVTVSDVRRARALIAKLRGETNA